MVPSWHSVVIAARTNRRHGSTHQFPDGKASSDSASACSPPAAARCVALCAGLHHSHHARKPCHLSTPSARAASVQSRKQNYLRDELQTRGEFPGSPKQLSSEPSTKTNNAGFP